MRQSQSVRRLAAGLLALTLLTGCSVRSISDSGYERGHPRNAATASNPFYRGELSEFDVLGIDRGKPVSEQEIGQALDARVPMSLTRGASIMLIQSGALIPDDPMVKALEKYYTVGVFSGVPPSAQTAAAGDANGTAAETYARSLRLSAARGAYQKIVVYWGLLETAQENLVTRTVSWVPVVGWALPDQRQRMRIRLKVAVIDVRSGRWEMFSPEAFDDASISARFGREGSDQSQVWSLKDKAYVAAAADLVKRYAR